MFERPSDRFLSEIASSRVDPVYFSYFVNEAKAFVVFGSFACGCFGPDSDLDIFVVGDLSVRLKNPRVDLIVIDERRLESPQFLQSELAAHIREYGHWLRGDRSVISGASVGPDACAAKRTRIVRRLNAIRRGIGRWSKYYYFRYVELVCLDIIRLSMMVEGRAPAARQMLMAQALADRFIAMNDLEILLGERSEGAIQLTASQAEVCLASQWIAELARDVEWRQNCDIY